TKWPGRARPLTNAVEGAGRSVSDRDAGHVGALQGPAYGLRLIAIEAGEAGSVKLLVALGHRLGERIRLAQHAAGAAACRIETLARFAFGFQRADLNDPACMHDHRLHCT